MHTGGGGGGGGGGSAFGDIFKPGPKLKSQFPLMKEHSLSAEGGQAQVYGILHELCAVCSIDHVCNNARGLKTIKK